MKNVVILGSTGTIGKNTLQVIRSQRDRFNVTGLGCGNNIDLLSEQIEEFSPEYVYTENINTDLESRFSNIKFLHKEEGLVQLTTLEDAGFILCAIPGITALKATIEAIKKGKTIGLATKEIMVVAGSIVNSIAEESGALILPVDSEHNAIFQVIDVEKKEDIKKIYLTASGGPFYKKRVKDASVEDVLSHPVWNMGRKITVDSATMFNKAFEMIEAHHLFSLDAEKIDVLIHPEAIIHGMVEFNDNSIKGVFSPPDMKFPISYVLNYPEKRESVWGSIDFKTTSNFTLEPAEKSAEWFMLAQNAIRRQGSYPVVMNSANEAAANLFLEGHITFRDITDIVAEIVSKYNHSKQITINEIFAIDKNVKNEVKELAVSRNNFNRKN